MKQILTFLICLVLLINIIYLTTLQSCDRSQANVRTLVSNDCGVTWELIPAGSVIPKRITPCEFKTTIPGTGRILNGNSMEINL